ncbi:MAG: thermonuclease family protein [Burkholderiales bacterium]|nr:thermonuclease family protein [Burkholderiales bacterium]
MHVLWLVPLLYLVAAAAQAAESQSLRARVVSVTDGDTVTVITPAKKKMKVRLGGIDAPDKKQPFGKAAKAALSDLVQGRDVDLIGSKPDRREPFVAKIVHEGRDVNLELLRMGLAWWHVKFPEEQTAEDGEVYAAAESDARDAGLRLWSDFGAVPPWEWKQNPPETARLQ